MSAPVVAGPQIAPPVRRPLSVEFAVILAAGAALAHAVVTPEHFAHWTAAGVFFVAVALGQAWLALALLRMRATTRTLFLAIWGHVGVIVVYVVSRTSGIPFDPEAAAGRPHHGSAPFEGGGEAVGLLDAVTLGAELALMVLLVALLPSRWSRRTTTGLMLVGVVLWSAGAVGALS